MDDEGIASIEVDGTDLLDFDVYSGERGKRFIEFVFTIPNLSEGETTSQIVVRDVKGRTSTLLHTLRIDVTPPSLELVEVRDVGEGQLRVEGIARDDVAVSAIRINEVPLQFAASPEHRFALVVTANREALIVVEDSAGNRVERSLE